MFKLSTKRQIWALFRQKLKISIGLRRFQALFNKADFLREVFLGQIATFYL